MTECYAAVGGSAFPEAVFGDYVRDLPLPPGERGGVRGMHKGGFSRILAVRPPHPNPLPGGERGLFLLWEAGAAP